MHPTSRPWYKDTAGHVDATQKQGGKLGLVERRRYMADSRVVEMVGRLHVLMVSASIYGSCVARTPSR